MPYFLSKSFGSNKSLQFQPIKLRHTFSKFPNRNLILLMNNFKNTNLQHRVQNYSFLKIVMAYLLEKGVIIELSSVEIF